MPPKATNAEIDAKLDELRQFVRDQRETLSARRATTLVKSSRQNQSADECKWYMFLCKTAAAFTQEQAEHLKQTFALLGTVSNASTAGVPPPSSDEAEVLSRSVVPPPTDSASAAASSSTQNNKTRGATKRVPSVATKPNAETTVPASKRRKSEHESLDASSVAKPPTVKHKNHKASSAIPPTQRPRTGETDQNTETNKTKRTVEDCASCMSSTHGSSRQRPFTCAKTTLTRTGSL